MARGGATSTASPRSILPGGFAYGDYLRAGVIARFSPVMRAVPAFAADGGLVLGICNGFQVPAEAGLVPGALLRNRGAAVRAAARSRIAAERARHAVHPPRSAERRPLRMPIAHGEGCYFADDATLDELERDGQVLFRYVRADGTRGRRDRRPGQPERLAAGDRRRDQRRRQRRRPDAAPGDAPSEAILGSDDGLGILRSLVESAAARRRGGAAGPSRWRPDDRWPSAPRRAVTSRSTARSA